MKKKYKVIDTRYIDKFETDLNEYQRDGWRLVSWDIKGSDYIAVMKMSFFHRYFW